MLFWREITITWRIVLAGLCTSARAAIAFIMLGGAAGPAHGQAKSDLGWGFTGQLTSVWTGGNSEARTFGLRSTLRRRAERSEVKLESGGIRTDATRVTRRAVGTATDFEIDKEETRVKTAEAYYGRLRYDRKVGRATLVFTGVDVLRNTFAGIDSRVLLAAGAGTVWADREDFRFKTDYGITYTFQSDVVENPFMKSNFPGARVSWDLRRRVTATTRFESVLTTDVNFADTDDIRFDFTNGLPVAINKSLSLKPGLQLVWRNQPALTAVDLFAPDGTRTGTKVSVPLEKLDSFFTLALVVTLQ